jgi:hypothetical protein
MDGRCTFTVGYKYHCPNATTRLLHRILIVSMFIKIAIQALGSWKRVMSITIFVFDNNTNKPFINTSFGGGGNS